MIPVWHAVSHRIRRADVVAAALVPRPFSITPLVTIRVRVATAIPTIVSAIKEKSTTRTSCSVKGGKRRDGASEHYALACESTAKLLLVPRHDPNDPTRLRANRRRGRRAAFFFGEP